MLTTGRLRLPPGRSRAALLADDPGKAPVVHSVTREHRAQIARAKVPGQNLGEEIAEVGRDGDVAAFEPRLGRESRPLPRYPATLHVASQHQHGGRMAVIGAVGAV